MRVSLCFLHAFGHELEEPNNPSQVHKLRCTEQEQCAVLTAGHVLLQRQTWRSSQLLHSRLQCHYLLPPCHNSGWCSQPECLASDHQWHEDATSSCVISLIPDHGNPLSEHHCREVGLMLFNCDGLIPVTYSFNGGWLAVMVYHCHHNFIIFLSFSCPPDERIPNKVLFSSATLNPRSQQQNTSRESSCIGFLALNSRVDEDFKLHAVVKISHFALLSSYK
ncbi:unnamed protein product, partial [Vitis vinifera]